MPGGVARGRGDAAATRPFLPVAARRLSGAHGGRAGCRTGDPRRAGARPGSLGGERRHARAADPGGSRDRARGRPGWRPRRHPASRRSARPVAAAAVRIDIVTLFPGMVEPALAESMLGRARARGLVDIRVVNLRDYAEGRHRVTDDYQFGGGGGMVLKPEPLFAAVEALRTPGARVPAVLLSGDHARIARWRRVQAIWLTWRERPDLLATARLTPEERKLVERFERGETPEQLDDPAN